MATQHDDQNIVVVFWTFFPQKVQQCVFRFDLY